MRPTSLLLATALGLAWTSALMAQHDVTSESGTAYVDGSCSECEGRHDAEFRSRVHEHWSKFCHEFREAHRWPEPYNYMARASVREMLNAQVTKGWTRETTLYDHHFEPGTNHLSSAGRRRLQYITQQVRPEHRFIYVQAGAEPADTQDRLAEVRNEACAVIGAENCPPIAAVNQFSRGARADEMTRIRELWITSTPTPRIPKNSGGFGGGASAGGGGGR
jgi:hypothetical protein